MEENNRKNDSGKIRWDLLPIEIVEEIAKVYTFGIEKYKIPHSWKKVENAEERYYAALMRHITEWRKGSINDLESGLHHLSHAAWNCIALIFFDWQKMGKYEREKMKENLYSMLDKDVISIGEKFIDRLKNQDGIEKIENCEC